MRKVDFKVGGEAKPIAIIYNPASGKKTNLVPLIEARLNQEGIPFELMPTGQYLDSYNFAKDIDIAKYSVLCCCGGDGSYHEVVNGMLNRPDKIKIPVAFIGNGSGNDLLRALGVFNLDQALDYIVKGECIKIDSVRVLMDHDSEDTLPSGNDRLNYCRHMMINSAIAMPAKIANTAIQFKTCCGTRSYEIATVWEACKGNFRPDNYEMFIDDKPVHQPNSHI